MANGYNTLLAIMICVKYGPDSNVSSPLNFPVPTEAFKHVSKLTTKDERVRALKIYWTPIMRSWVRAQHVGYVTRLQQRGSPRPHCHYHWYLCQNRDQGHKVRIHPVHSHSFSCHWERNCDRPLQRTLGLLRGTNQRSAPPFHPRRCLSILTPLFPIWQMSSVQFSACSIVLLPRPLHAPCCTTAS